ncbi:MULTISPECIES: ROK family protein [unclassified Streptomyces]|uniref:ROK family protein n=1 Tax=unclassified Streptomyces TaxID=2593676 RepID=UPI00338D497C
MATALGRLGDSRSTVVLLPVHPICASAGEDLAARRQPEPRTWRSGCSPRARAGDPLAQAAVERFSTADAQGIVARCLTVDPQLVVLGGGISRSAGIALGHITEERERVCIRGPGCRLRAGPGDRRARGGTDRPGLGRRAVLHPRAAEPLAPPQGHGTARRK